MRFESLGVRVVKGWAKGLELGSRVQGLGSRVRVEDLGLVI